MEGRERFDEANIKLFKHVYACCDTADGPYVADKICMQHDLQNVKSRVTGILDLQAPLFCLSKQMSLSSYAQNCEDAVYAWLDKNLVWKTARRMFFFVCSRCVHKDTGGRSVPSRSLPFGTFGTFHRNTTDSRHISPPPQSSTTLHGDESGDDADASVDVYLRLIQQN